MGFFSRFEETAEEREVPASTQETLRNSIEAADLPENIRRVALDEIAKLDRIDPSVAEFGVGVTYVELLLSLPWKESSQDNLDIENAVAVLQQEHLGLAAVKQRILEYLASNINHHVRKSVVLVVDDEEISRDNIAYALSKLSCDILKAANGKEAVHILENRKVDCIVTDLKMQQMDGLELLDKVQTSWPDTKLLIVTGYATVDNAISALQKGAVHYLPKPLNLEVLKVTVKDILDQKKHACSVSGPILCFSGPPGTGKTSIGKSVANALGRKFIRLSLAGMRDEAELRGHRRTYVGAMTGRIITELNKAGVNNPVFMLDEIDKIGQDFRGDPASVLLEILDPEQNRQFLDYYLDVPFDLSRVMFITTANMVDRLPAPLRDRMEIIPFSCYTLSEKVHIGLEYLLPRQMQAIGFADNDISFTADGMSALITGYTRDAGLRSINREIGNVCRKVNLRILQGETLKPVVIDKSDIFDLLGDTRFVSEAAMATPRVGVVAGLVWSESGGQVIYIETAKMKGSGQLIMTGSLGDVLKESAQTALSFLRSNAQHYSIEDELFSTHDIHVHIPAGDISKDGASAGITIVTALLSLLVNRPLRGNVAMTGEFTLSGRLLPVGGLREKILAAQQAGMKQIILPEWSKQQVLAMDEEVVTAVDLHFVSSLDDVLPHVFAE
ncbi:S16 family serine protease [Halodesulfovibrio marinisediminis]|uniref:endopeptidase La n=1 Tax=Halodesulfovibrio marinisediminis DSM 17456 TaxID=1121457 RepID=A0A1N6DX68_9BACT|nr:S16 family serine protease [Halodesulfovibrio marinisediminis]SIN75350.1 ATP-dependent Lon protease [Halodesulfovibrio marinisediminis DSM 17456]